MKILPRILNATAAMILIAGGMSAPVAMAAESAPSLYTRALIRERQLRDAVSGGGLSQLRATVQVYESVVRRYPKSGYSDNALWQAANLSLLAFERFRQPIDKRTALRLLKHLAQHYPHSPFVARAAQIVKNIEADGHETRIDVVPNQLPPPPVIESRDIRPVAPVLPPAAAAPAVVTIRHIKRTPLPDGVRVSIEMDGESLFRSERLENPPRVFFDLRSARAVAALQDATLTFEDDVVREIRLGRHPQNTTRVVMDMEDVEGYSVFTLYNPFRVVVDFRRMASASAPEADPRGLLSLARNANRGSGAADPAGAEAKSVPAARNPLPLLSRPAAATVAVSPVAPAANSNGQFSLARQLGLGVSRIVLDPGHGGHDPGARANGINEAELVLDVTLRLRDLLQKQPGVEVTLTRDKDEFIPLEERTAIANRLGADLFLSIHANASRNPKARGIETYFLNFASNPEAEAVAARENAGSAKTMHSLPEIVRAIALNNKIDESRDFAEMVQKAMVRRLMTRNKQIRDLGVKQAPFVVLIGAGMPSVLAEISFVTHKQESALLKTGTYREQIAESLLDAILRYQRSLKGVRVVAAKE